MYAVLVADTEIDAQGHADPSIVGPFPDAESAIDYAYGVARYIVQVIPMLDVPSADKAGI